MIYSVYDKITGCQNPINSMFCIENQLFDDTRFPGYMRYSANIIEKLSQFNKETIDWSILSQHEYKLGDLKITLGKLGFVV